MHIILYNPKGGCSKSSISLALYQILGNYQIITNDKMHGYNLVLPEDKFYLVPDNSEIPTFNPKENLIYDLGGFPDARIFQFLKAEKSAILLIPFTPDILAFQAACSLYNEIKNITPNIIFIITRAKPNDYDIFSQQLKKLKINKGLFEIKESKFFPNLFNTRLKIDEIKENKLANHSYKPVLDQLNKLIEEIKK